jgi:hypothetical protein
MVEKRTKFAAVPNGGACAKLRVGIRKNTTNNDLNRNAFMINVFYLLQM